MASLIKPLALAARCRSAHRILPLIRTLANVSTVPSTLDSDVEAFLARVEAGDVPPKLLDSLLPTELAESADPSKTVFTEAWRSNGLTGEGWSVDQLTRATPAEVPVFSTGGDDKGLTALFRAALPQCTEKQLGYIPGDLEVLERRPTTAVIETLLGEHGEIQNPRVALVGPPGTGKTTALTHVCAKAHEAGWIVAHVPDASAWTDDLQDIEPSSWNTDRLDQFQQAVDWLGYFLEWNGDKLEALQLQGEYNWEGMSMSGAPADLRALAEKGQEDARVAVDIVGILLTEIAKSSTPLLLAVDGYNAWRHTPYTKFLDFEAVPVSIERAALVRHFVDMIDSQLPSLPNAAAVVTESEKFGAVLLADLTNNGTVPFMAAEYGDYSSYELQAVADNYQERGLMSKGIVSTETSLPQLTGSNPRRTHMMLIKM